MGPLSQGHSDGCRLLRLLLAELEIQIQNKMATIEGERFRLYWDGMPMWGGSDHSDLFASAAVNVLASTYCNRWIFSAFDPEDPFNSMQGPIQSFSLYGPMTPRKTISGA